MNMNNYLSLLSVHFHRHPLDMEREYNADHLALYISMFHYSDRNSGACSLSHKHIYTACFEHAEQHHLLDTHMKHPADKLSFSFDIHYICMIQYLLLVHIVLDLCSSYILSENALKQVLGLERNKVRLKASIKNPSCDTMSL